jgi:hypothetical protein
METRWSPATRIAFRFAFSYFVLFFLALDTGELIPGVLIRKYFALWLPVLDWIARHILHLGYAVRLQDAGIGNTAYGWTLVLCYLPLAAVTAAVWSALDRKRLHYEGLHQGFRLLLRFMLAISMIGYGAVKVIPTQMISPLPVGVLSVPIGNLPSYHLLWWTIGASPAFETFIGLAEMVGGLLLLVPRTTLLGALLCAANTLTVFMLNMCYDVVVKIYSLHLLIMALILLAPDLRRLAGVFFLDRRVEPARAAPIFTNRWLDRAPQVLLFLWGLYTMGVSLEQAYESYGKRHPPPPPLYGAWSVEELVVDGREAADPERWRWVRIASPGKLQVERVNGAVERYTLDLDPKRKTLRLWKSGLNAAELSFREPDADVLLLEGRLDGHRVRASLGRMPLLRGSFHWIAPVRREAGTG